MARPLPRGDYFAFVSRTERRPRSDVYAWSLRDPLPTIPIPLLSPDPDIPLDLAAIFATVYQRGRYEQSIDYGEPLVLPLSAEDRAWAENGRGPASHDRPADAPWWHRPGSHLKSLQHTRLRTHSGTDTASRARILVVKNRHLAQNSD